MLKPVHPTYLKKKKTTQKRHIPFAGKWLKTISRGGEGQFRQRILHVGVFGTGVAVHDLDRGSVTVTAARTSTEHIGTIIVTDVHTSAALDLVDVIIIHSCSHFWL